MLRSLAATVSVCALVSSGSHALAARKGGPGRQSPAATSKTGPGRVHALLGISVDRAHRKVSLDVARRPILSLGWAPEGTHAGEIVIGAAPTHSKAGVV